MRPLEAARRVVPLYYTGLKTLGVTAASRRVRNAGLILCYHNVVRATAPWGAPGLHVSVDVFERQMRWLASRYSVVPLGEFLDRMEARASLRSLAVVTFDDAYAGVFEHAVPVLNALRIPATVFVVASASASASGFWWDHPDIAQRTTSERRMAWLNDLRGDGPAILRIHAGSRPPATPASHRAAEWPIIRASLAGGIDIGVHSATHRALPLLSDAELEYEVVHSRDVVRHAIGRRPEFFAYPYGHWNAQVRARLVDAGYRAALTLDPGLNDAGTDPWELRRINVPAGISDDAFDAWTAGLRAGWNT